MSTHVQLTSTRSQGTRTCVGIHAHMHPHTHERPQRHTRMYITRAQSHKHTCSTLRDMHIRTHAQALAVHVHSCSFRCNNEHSCAHTCSDMCTLGYCP